MEKRDANGEGGKMPTKTLMFIERCPTLLGCTILLKGTHIDELKSIKCVMQCASIMAYNLILEISFLVDQKAMLSTFLPITVADILPINQEPIDSSSINSSVSQTFEHSDENGIVSTDIPVYNGLHEKSTDGLTVESEELSSFSYEPCNPSLHTKFRMNSVNHKIQSRK
ncbi:hypothetical protein RYX36_004860 [Vicia faba]